MAEDVLALRVLIASPSDTAEARAAIVQAIVEWNDLNMSALGVVLVPTMWEISSSPEAGDRPQAIINRQVVDRSDLLVGTFWTRLGTKTGDSLSGTAEEIDRFRDRDAPVLLYFSSQPAAPNLIDGAQLAELAAYRRSLESGALLGSYENVAELGHKLQRDLRRIVESMRGAESRPGPVNAGSGPERAPSASPSIDSVARVHVRRAVGRAEPALAGAIADDDLTGVQSTMYELAGELAAILGELSSLSASAHSEPVYGRIRDLSQEAARLHRFDVFLDGGKTWRELCGLSLGLLDDLRALGSDDAD